jgi:uncharacterized protein with FMN-binding domain
MAEHSLTPDKTSHKRSTRSQRERVFIVFTTLVIITAWVIGYFRKDSDALAFAYKVIPTAERVEQNGSLYIGRTADGESIVGYAAVGEAPGYAGPIKVIVGMDLSGEILEVKIIENRESPGFFRLVASTGFIDQFLEQNVKSPLQLGTDIDGISGATLSSEGIAASTRQAVREIAVNGLNTSRPPEKKQIKFGLPEIVLIGLYAAGYFSHKQKNPKLKVRFRWLTLTTGMIVLGFIYTAPLTISQIIALLSGYWPDWHNNLYWYLLIGGILFVTTVDAKNPYCAWFCPFGAFQETLAAVTGAKHFRPRPWRKILTWLPRVLALTAIVLGLVLRQPGVAGYEPFATLFDLRGTAFEWILLAITILASLIFYRPFCSFICPIDPVVDFIHAIRRFGKDVRRQWQQKPAQK